MKHRERVYDPQHSTRKFKRFHRMTTSGYQTEVAYDMGQCSILTDLPKRWRQNPYPVGRRHDAYEAGCRAGLLQQEEDKQIRNWLEKL